MEQEGRLCRIDSPLGENVLFLQEFSGREGISQLFHFDCLLVSENGAIDFDEIIGQKVTLAVNLAEGGQRFFNGVVSRFSQVGSDIRITTYRAEIVPWMWLLTRRTDCRIFQNKTVQEIVEAVFGNLGFTDFEFSLNGKYDPMVNCVQYRESDFNFVSRLLETAGIYYYFRHENGKHTLVIADSASHHEAVPGQEKARLDPSPDSTNDTDRVENWRVDQILQPGKYALKDYNYIDPGTDLLVDAGSDIKAGNNADLEVYDYPGVYVNLGGEDDAKLEKGDVRVGIRREEGDCQAVLHQGDGCCRAFTTGYKFDLEGHARSDLNTTYLLTEIEHYLSQKGNLVSGTDVVFLYRNSFKAIAHAVPYRPRRITNKPQVRGPQTAVVTGPSGEEIYTDKYGRVKVQFHWDREGKLDENSSCWIRVAQHLAGKEWGMIFHPRIGQEVVVDFLEGDPDRPLITGRVYNARQPIPYSKPTQSGVKTRSTKDGSPENFNEIRFEDLKGSEELYIHAEKNETIVVEADKSESVGHDETISIGNDRKEDVGHDETVTIGNNETRTIGTDRSVTVGSNETLAVGADRNRQVGSNETITVTMARTHNVGVNEAINVGATQEVQVGAERKINVGGSQELNVGGNLTEAVGKKLDLNAGDDGTIKIGKKLSIEAGDEISIVAGKAKIVMKKDGTINIEGKNLTVKGSGKITVKASKDVVLKGKKILQN